MARAQSPDSANSQFFIMFAPAPPLDGQYTVVGRVVDGMEIVDAIKRGTGRNGAVVGQPDRMVALRVLEEDPVRAGGRGGGYRRLIAPSEHDRVRGGFRAPFSVAV
jgi:cyclophilin family peptidyl-prolyl cis-trans isomerase